MPQGLQTFDENGDMVINITDRIQKYLGIINCPENQNSGEVRNGQLTEGDLWYLIIPNSYPTLNLSGNNQYQYSVPFVSKNGDKVEWYFTQNHVGCQILYGVF